MITLLDFTFSLLLSLIINIDFNEAAEGGTDNEHLAAIWKGKKYIKRMFQSPQYTVVILENLGELEFLVLESIGYSNALAINFIEDIDENRDRDSTEHGLRRYYTRYTI